jgi:hypothetical protein
MVILARKPLVLVDEPEAFLHPPQALELGRIFAEMATAEQPLVCATHSVDLLRGILSHRTDVNILRLSRLGDETVARLVDTAKVQQISQNPILSSSRVLDGLFYSGVVVTEADSDEVFYQRVALTCFRGDDIHYTHAHNKQTIYKLIEPYKSAGIPYAAIVDFDILRSTDEFRILAVSAGAENVPELVALQQKIQAELDGDVATEREKILISDLAKLVGEATPSNSSEEADANILRLRRETKSLFDSADAWAKAKKSGRAALTKETQAVFDDLNRKCRTCGIFIVLIGDLEGWLEELGHQRSANKSKWITDALTWLYKNRLSKDSSIYKFVKEVHEHLVGK